MDRSGAGSGGDGGLAGGGWGGGVAGKSVAGSTSCADCHLSAFGLVGVGAISSSGRVVTGGRGRVGDTTARTVDEGRSVTIHSTPAASNATRSSKFDWALNCSTTTAGSDPNRACASFVGIPSCWLSDSAASSRFEYPVTRSCSDLFVRAFWTVPLAFLDRDARTRVTTNRIIIKKKNLLMSRGYSGPFRNCGLIAPDADVMALGTHPAHHASAER